MPTGAIVVQIWDPLSGLVLNPVLQDELIPSTVNWDELSCS